jgi:ankyrin repeat protein
MVWAMIIWIFIFCFFFQSCAMELRQEAAAGLDNEPSHLQRAVMLGDHQQLQELISEGVDFTKCYRGMTILHLAVQRGDPTITRLLLTQTPVLIILNRVDFFGRTPLLVACKKGFFKIVSLLVKAGADICCIDASGKDVLYYLRKRTKWNDGTPLEVAELIASHGHRVSLGELVRGLAYLSSSREKKPLVKTLEQMVLDTAAVSNLPVLKYLVLDEGISVQSKDADNQTPMHKAASYGGNAELSAFLFSLGADPHARDVEGRTPLHVAAEGASDAVAIAAWLLDLRVSIDDPCSVKKETALHKASKKGHLRLVKLLVGRNADLYVRSTDGYTALHYAIANGHTALVRWFIVDCSPKLDIGKIEKGSLQLTDKDSLLHIAAQYGTKEILTFLLSPEILNIIVDAFISGNSQRDACSAGVDIINASGKTPLYVAAENGHADYMSLLLSDGASISRLCHGSKDKTALHLAVSKGYVDVVKMLLQNGANFSCIDLEGNTPLHDAAKGGFVDVAGALIAHGIEIDRKNKRGQTALHVAAGSGHLKTVRILLDAGADIQAVDLRRRTALHCTASSGHLDVMKFLLERGASLSAIGEDDITCLHRAVFNGRKEVVEFLLSKGVNINAKCSDGRTPLHDAARKNQIEVVKVLLAKGADAKAINNDGQAPWEVTKDREIRKLLRK